MNLADITTKCYILALIIRDDGERLLLGDGAYEFKDSQQHFIANTYANDVVELQGTDGQMLAGQVRRTATQTFAGYIGDATFSKQKVEAARRDFMMFFRKKHYYTAVYIFSDGTAIQRDRGYIVNAPSAPELYQRFPEWSVGLNFEDPNYYEYAEDDLGHEIAAHKVELELSTAMSGGLVWDEDGAVSDDLSYIGTEIEGEGKNFQLADTGTATLKSAELLGDASQTTYSGKNLWQFDSSYANTDSSSRWVLTDRAVSIPAGTYTFNCSRTPSNGNVRINYKYADNLDNIIAITPPQTLTFSDEVKKIAMTLGGNVSVSDIQIEAGSTATAYEPYVGGTASPNPDYPQAVNTATGEQTVKITGKNLLEPMPRTTTSGGASYEWKENGDIIISGTTTGTSWFRSAQESTTQFDAHLGAGTYAFTVFGDTIGASFRLYDETGAYIATTQTSTLFTLTEATKVGLQIRVASGTTTNITAQVQLELAHNSFEPSYLPTSWTNTTAVYETLNLQPNTTYTMSSTIPRASGNALLFFLESGQSIATNTNGIWDGQTRTLTTNATGNNLQLAYRSFSGETRTRDDYDYALLSATTYEPYQGQVKTVNLGKNLFDKDNLPTLNNDYIDSTGKIVSGSGNKLTYVKLQPNKTYTLTQTIKSNVNVRVGLFASTPNEGSTGTVIGTYSGSNPIKSTFTTTSTNFYVAWVYLNTEHMEGHTTDEFLGSIQVEAGQATSYAPYFAPIELAKIGNYQDRIYKTNGKWFIEKQVGKVVLDGSEAWTRSTYGNYSAYYNTTYRDMGNKPKLCDYYTYRNTVWNTITTGPILCENSNPDAPLLIFSGFTDITSVADWRTWLSGHPTTVYSALATPITTEITNSELIKQLERLRHSHTYADTTNFSITATSPNLPAFLKVVAFGKDAIPQGGYVWEDGGAGGATTITVDGVDNAQPIWTVVGPATNPSLTNITTGESIQWTGVVPNGQTLVVNMADMTASLSGANVFEFISGSWITLQAGNNRVSYSATAATGIATLEWNGVVG